MRIRSCTSKGIMVALCALISTMVFLGQDSMQPLADDGVIIIGSEVPPLRISQVGDDSDLSDGALVPIDKDVILRAVSDEAGNMESAVFQSAKLSSDGSPAQWRDIPGTVDLTILAGSVVAVSIWDTTLIEPGRYDLRCISADSSGNSNPEMAPIVHVVVGAGKYSAFVTDPADNGSVSGASTIVKAWIYNASTDLASIKSVTFQYQDANGAWSIFDSITNSPANNLAGDPNAGIKRGYLQFSNHSEWHGKWNLTGLIAGQYRLRALVEDDQGYVNDGVAVSVLFAGAAGVRTRIVNFSSDSGQNPRVSMNIARNSSFGDIIVRDFKNFPVESIRVTFKAERVGGETPDRVRFEYLKNPVNNPANPKTAPAFAWTLIHEDQYAENGLWVADLDIDPTHELHNLSVATLIYVRAAAIKNNVADEYVDESDFVPYVGLIFEETIEPDCDIAMISRDGVSLGPAPSVEERVTGGELTVVPSAQSSEIAQVELYYKLYREPGFSDTQFKWIFADRDTSLPFTLLWDVSNPIQVPSGKYELLVVASDHAGNRSANVWDSLDALRGQPNLIANLQIDSSEPIAYLEEPDPGGRLTPDSEIWLSASSYQGEIDEIVLWFNLGTAGGWVEAGRAGNFPAFGFRSVKTQLANFSNNLGGGYYYYDRNGNDVYDAGEPIWQDLSGGNSGWYNYSKRTVEESILMGGPRPPDETKGVRFEDIPGEVTNITCVQGVVKWGDSIASGGVVGGLDKTDFIWIDLPEPGYPNGDGMYDSSNDGTGEPIIYASGMIHWDGIMNLPPSNNMSLEFRVQACDKQDSSGSSGNCGPAVPSETMVGGATVAVQSVNDVYIGDFGDEYMRVTGDTVRVVVRVWPEPISGAEVQLWFRYDDSLNPGALDEDYDGYPDNGDVANSKWDGIDNDRDGVIDEEQTDKYGNEVEWGEVNVWQLASTTGGRTVTDREPGSAAESPAKNWFEVMLTWNVSMLNDEHQYEFMPIVVDGSGYGVNFNYPSLPWKRSDAQFPQGPIISEYRIIIDHQAPYTYTQVVKNTDDYGPTDQGLDSWMPLIYPESQFAGPDSMIVRTNDGVNNNADADGCYDEAGEDNYRLYDLQAKVVSIYGGLDYTAGFDEGLGGVGAPFNPNAGGVIFQYSTDGVTWRDLGYDPDPDYLSTFAATFNPAAMRSSPIQRYQGSEMSYVGKTIPYTGRIINSDGIFTGQAVAYTQRIVVATWSLDNFDISALPATNGAEYYFRAIAADLPDIYGSGRKNTTADEISSHRDELVVENGIGKGDQNFMRDINWKLGVPFEVMPTSNASHRDLFRNLHIDVTNLEYVTGPRNADKADNDGDGLVDEDDENDGVDTNYWVNSIVPEARIMKVGQAVFWTPQGGFDESAEAFLPPGEHVLIEAVANSNPADRTGWGKNSDVAQVRFYTRPVDMVGGSPPHNGWTLAGSDDYSPYTIRINTDRLGTGSFQLMALAEDKNGNMEPFPCAGPGDLNAWVQDMSGPSISVGGLGLDLSHSNYVPVGIMELIIPYLNSTFIHELGFEANNLGNSIFPPLSQGGVPKVSGEWLHLYVQSEVYGDVPGDGITVSVYDKNNSEVARPAVAYAKDTKVGDEYKPGEIPHTFILSEQTALLYLPTWQELGVNVPRFEGVMLHYKKVDNVNGTGVTVKPGDPYFVDKVRMTSYYNGKGEHIWKADLNLELGHTYFYYFVVDTVGDTWVMPDPRNLLYEGFVGGSQYSNLMDWFSGFQSNLFLNVPLVSKIWLPGTPGQDDDEIWSTAINLNSLADGVYEVRIQGKDRIGFTDMVSKTIVVDRTPPQIDPDVDIKISSSVKAGSVVELRAIIRDSSGVNAVETSGVLFEISRKGNTPDAIGVWQYAIGPGSVSYPQMPVPGGWQFAGGSLGTPSWLGKIALDIYPQDGWSALWQTPQTDQQIPIYVRAVPFDDALNVQVGDANQGAVDVDGSVSKAKLVGVSVSRAGTVVEDGADGFVIFPIDKDVTLKATLVGGFADASGVTFQYNLGDGWVTIPASQYSEAVRVPNSEGEYVVVWQIDFSQLANETKDQYFQVRAVAEDEVGNVDGDPIPSIMVFDNATPPQVYIKAVDGKDALSPNLSVSRRSFNVEGGDPGTVDVEIKAYNATTVTLEYRSEGGDWIEVATVTGASDTFIIEWGVAALTEGIYELRAIGYSSSGYPSIEPVTAVITVERTEPAVRNANIWVDTDSDGEYESDELIYPGYGIYRYMDGSGAYFDVRIQVEVVDDSGVRDVTLQYFNQDTAQWETVNLSDGSDARFSYSAVDDLWTISLEGDDALGLLVPQTASGQDGSFPLRALATDYAGNQNSQDRGFGLEVAEIIKGDVNGDGKIQANDAFLALQIAAGVIEPDEAQSHAADMNGDGRVRTNDAIQILRKAAEM